MYSIGEISRMVKISSDTLRYYDEIQLLNPDYINPSNNYRFYNEEQVKELLYIMELKEFGFNLDEIKKILKSDETKVRNLFRKKKADLFIQNNKINASIEKIENRLKLMGEYDMKDKILIVDDAAFLRNIVKDMMEKNGYEVVEAVDGIDGIAKYKEHKPALTIMDIVMPNMDGIEAMAEIKKIDSNAKIVMLSAMGQPEYIYRSLIEGAVDFIVKPFQADSLTAAVAKHLAEDIKLNLAEVTLWNAECNERNAAVAAETPKISIDKVKLTEKLTEAVKSCVDAPVDNVQYQELSGMLLDTVHNYFNSGTVPVTNEKLCQDEINALLIRFTKG
jgi:two-component system chemotaxis response regulator CheY